MAGPECRFTDEVAVHVLGLQSEEERRRFLSHAATCAACRLSMAELSAVVDLLPYAAAPVEASPSLLDRILVQAEPRPRPRRHWWAWAAAAAACVALLAGALTFTLREAPPQPAASGATLFRLAPTDAAPGAKAELVMWDSADGTHFMLMASGLPPTTGDQVYHLWLLHGEQRRSGGTFRVDQSGKGLLYRVATLPPGITAAGVTLEPDGSLPEPRGVRVLSTAQR